MILRGNDDPPVQLEIRALDDDRLRCVLEFGEPPSERLRSSVAMRSSRRSSFGDRDSGSGQPGVDETHACGQDGEVAVDRHEDATMPRFPASKDHLIASVHGLDGDVGQGSPSTSLLIGELLDILGFPPELAADRLTQLRAELTQITFVERLLSHRLATVT